jgi:hypothetical protein
MEITQRSAGAGKKEAQVFRGISQKPQSDN